MRVDCVIKLGGSLLYDFSKTKELLKEIYATKNGNLAVTVGSGALGELYKDFISKLAPNEIPFNDSVRDYSNIQSINASIITALNENYIVCETKEDVEKCFESNKIAILDARGFMSAFKDDTFQRGDVRAANLCKYFDCHNLIVITNVNGVYDSDPNKNDNAHLIEKITPEDLKKMGRTAVDNGLAERIEEYDLTCYVIGIDSLLNNKGNIDSTLSEGTKIERGEKVYAKN